MGICKSHYLLNSDIFLSLTKEVLLLIFWTCDRLVCSLKETLIIDMTPGQSHIFTSIIVLREQCIYAGSTEDYSLNTNNCKEPYDLILYAYLYNYLTTVD